MKLKHYLLIGILLFIVKVHSQSNYCFDVRYKKIQKFTNNFLKDSIDKEFKDHWNVLRRRGKLKLKNSPDLFLFPNLNFLEVDSMMKNDIETILHDSIQYRVNDVSRKKRYSSNNDKYVKGYSFYSLDDSFFPYLEPKNFFFFDWTHSLIYKENEYSGKCALFTYSRIINNICGMMVLPEVIKGSTFSDNLFQNKPLVYIFYFSNIGKIKKVDKVNLDIYYSFYGKPIINDFKCITIFINNNQPK